MNGFKKWTKHALVGVLSLALVLGHFLGLNVLATSDVVGVSDEEVIWSLSTDSVIQGLNTGDTHQPGFWDNTPFQGAGDPLFTIVPHPVSGNSIQISDRSDDWDALDIRRVDIPIVEGYEYEIQFLGRVLDAPSSTQVILGGAESPFSWIGNSAPAADGSFSIVITSNHEHFWQTTGGIQNRFRFQTNNTADFIIDDIIVTRTGTASTPSEEGELHWDLATWLTGAGFIEGTVLQWTDDSLVRNAGSTVTVGSNDSVIITDRGADWNGADVRFELYPGDRIELVGTVPAPVPAGATVRLQRLPGYGNFNTFPINADGTFTVTHIVTEEQATGSTGFRINSNAEGADLDITIASLRVYRQEGAVAGTPPEIIIPMPVLPELPESYLGDYVLRVEIGQGNQWDGLRLNRNVIAPYLSADGVYEFSFDLLDLSHN